MDRPPTPHRPLSQWIGRHGDDFTDLLVSMERPPTPHRPHPPNAPRDSSPLHSDEGCNVNPLQHLSEPSAVLPVQNDIAISAVETTSWNTAAPTPMPPTSCPATFASFTTFSYPPSSPVPSPEELSSTQWAELLAEDSYQKWRSCFPPLPQVIPSSSSQPGSCEEPSTCGHEGQASSSKEHSSTVRAQLLGEDFQLKDLKTTIKLSSELAETEDRLSSELPEFADRFRQRRLGSGVPRLPPLLSLSSSSQPGSCYKPCTSAPVKILGIPLWPWSLLPYSELAETEDHRMSSELVNLKYHFLQEWLSSGLPLLSGWTFPRWRSCTSAHAGQASSSEDKIEAAPGVSRIPTNSDSRDFGEYETPTKRTKKVLR